MKIRIRATKSLMSEKFRKENDRRRAFEEIIAKEELRRLLKHRVEEKSEESEKLEDNNGKKSEFKPNYINMMRTKREYDILRDQIRAREESKKEVESKNSSLFRDNRIFFGKVKTDITRDFQHRIMKD